MDTQILKSNSIWPYSVAFLSCLVVLGALVGVNYHLISRIVDQGALAVKISQAGTNQLTTAYRIAGVANAYANNSDPNSGTAQREDLVAAINQLRATHRTLIRGNPKQGFPAPESDAVDKIIFDSPHQLDEEVRRFLFAANELVSREWTPDLADIVYLKEMSDRINGSLRDGLDALVIQLSLENSQEVDRLRLVTFSMAILTISLLVLMFLFVFLPLLRRLSRQTQNLVDMARTDPMTGCHNRRSFLAMAEAELDRHRRYNSDLAVIMLDIDKFKSVNDTHGHAAGDEVIKALARVCLECLRKSDVLGRLGGEEFAIVLPETSSDRSVLVAEKIRVALADANVECDDKVITFTSSFGIAVANHKGEDFHDILTRADEALYEAKNTGRNRVVGPINSLER